MNRSLKTLAAILFASALTTWLSAVPITGNIALEGGATLNGPLATATQVNTFSNVKVTSVSTGSILDTTINPGDAVAMSSPWTFTSGISALWSVGGFTFDLLTSSVVFQNSHFLSVEGTGNAWGNGYDSTPGTWRFSTQTPAGAHGVFSFSAATAIPDGGTTALLLGLGLTGLALISRIRRQIC